ncbi:hypothetical protein H9P43_008241 [Blastocladiella emersonii ATCC 22665]|nr:hypothetical protein H9P43_008241 [Blastocladiella emersonii ATCC 22665]
MNPPPPPPPPGEFPALQQLIEHVSNADPITQLQNRIEDYAFKLAIATEHMHVRASMLAVNPAFPVTQVNERSEEEESFKRNLDEFARDLALRTREIVDSVDQLPAAPMDMAAFQPVYAEVLTDNAAAAEELRSAIQDGERMLATVRAVRARILELEMARMGDVEPAEPAAAQATPPGEEEEGDEPMDTST